MVVNIEKREILIGIVALAVGVALGGGESLKKLIPAPAPARVSAPCECKRCPGTTGATGSIGSAIGKAGIK